MRTAYVEYGHGERQSAGVQKVPTPGLWIDNS